VSLDFVETGRDRPPVTLSVEPLWIQAFGPISKKE
jgi:hypothetical protein